MTRYEWGVFAFWVLVVLAIIAWLYSAVKKSHDESEELTRALEREMHEYNERRRTVRDFDAKPFALDPDDPWAA